MGVLGEGESKSLTIWAMGLDSPYCGILFANFDKTPALFNNKGKHQE